MASQKPFATLLSPCLPLMCRLKKVNIRSPRLSCCHMAQFQPRRYKQKSMLGVGVWEVPGKTCLKRQSQLAYTFVPFSVPVGSIDVRLRVRQPSRDPEEHKDGKNLGLILDGIIGQASSDFSSVSPSYLHET